MQAHANDLRAEIENSWGRLFAPDAVKPDAADELDAMVHQIVDDWRQAPIRKELMALCDYAEAITRSPANGSEAAILSLQKAEWTEKELLEALQVASYFNYINRLAESLGVTPEHGIPTWGRASNGQ